MVDLVRFDWGWDHEENQIPVQGVDIEMKLKSISINLLDIIQYCREPFTSYRRYFGFCWSKVIGDEVRFYHGD